MPTYDEMLDAALLAFARGKAAEAEAVQALDEAYPDRPGGPSLRALHLLWAGELENAQAVALGESAPERATRAEIAQYLGDDEGAKTLLDAAFDEAPDDPIVLRCATSVLGMGDPQVALAVARRRAALRPHDPTAHAAVGTALMQADAAEELERFAADPPPGFAGTSGLSVLRARLAMKRHELPEAEAHAREAVALSSDSGMAWATLAEILRFQGRKEEAERAARFSLELNPRNPIPLRVMASLAEARGARAEADEWKRQADEAIPALRFLGAMRQATELSRQGKPREALAALEPLRHAHGSSRLAARNIRTNLLLGLDDDAALAAEVASMEAEGVRSPLLVRAQAELDRRAGRLEDARDRLAAAWAKDRPGGIGGPLVKALAALGDLDAARGVAAEATTYVPGLPADIGALVMALEGAGLRDEARALLAAAQRRFPEAQLLELIRAGNLAEDGNVAGALRAIQGLDAVHRPTVRFKIPFGKLVRLLVRRMMGRGRSKG